MDHFFIYLIRPLATPPDIWQLDCIELPALYPWLETGEVRHANVPWMIHISGSVSNQNTQQALPLPKKEVIQPHLPVRLPCYDFTPITSPAFSIPPPAVKVTTSGMANSHSVTRGVYKAREQIHHYMADRRLLAIPASSRVSLGHKGHDDLTSSSPSSGLSSADLTQHLTARADNNHAPPVSAFPKAPLFFKRIRGMSSPGKVLRFASN
ncbi:hypothetical protein NC653_034651 [Populus alba x Populus x berolinensis]|uniref:Uncharacterized protein n=1 Tax=Populus alba x Populus x berolinensis TaxID=444605 RepID=A0AAD6LPA8_9ROSI|nr:hypothetical protein NC653_034651 [Populus alba x Populus x berolinensis]